MKFFSAILLSLLSLQACGQTAINNVNINTSSLALSPTNPTTVVGGTVTLNCIATTDTNGTRNITNQATFQSDNPAVAAFGTSNVLGLNIVTGISIGTSNLTCQDGAGDVSSPVTLTVLSSPAVTNPNASTCAIPCPLPGGSQTVAYPAFPFAAIGGVLPYVWSNSVGAPPTGMTLSSAGVLSGTPSGIGSTTWTVQVCDNLAACATLQVTIAIAVAPSCGTPPNYCANTGVGIVPWPSVPVVTGGGGDPLRRNGSTVVDSSLPASVQPTIMRVTDFYGEPGAVTATANAQSKSAGLGGSGDAEQLFSSNDTMLHYNSSGGFGRLTLFNPSTMVAGDPGTGFAITGDKKTPAGSATSYAFGGGTFSWTDAEVPAGYSAWYEVGSGADAPTNTTVAKATIKQSDGTFTVVTPYLDFINGLPFGTLAPAWQAGHPYALGAYISATIPGLNDWNGSAAYLPGDLIKPGTNNPAGCVFKVSALGTRGSQPTQWSTGSTCTTAQLNGENNGSTHNCNGGVQCYRNLGNNGTFVLQATKAGTSGGSTPVWGATPAGGLSIHPDLGSTVTDGTVTWTNSAVMITPPWNSFAGISKNSDRFCNAFTTSSYGHGVGSYNVDNADQNTGIYAVCYSFALNKFVLLNTLTGIQSTTSCSSAGGTSCGPLTAAGAALPSITGCPFQVHNDKGGSTLDYVVVAAGGNFGAPGCNENNLMMWAPFAAYNSTSTAQMLNTRSNHWTIGKSKFINVGASADNFGFNSGAYTIVIDATNPRSKGLTSWQVGLPYTNPCDIAWVPNDINPACAFGTPYDSHMAFWHDSLDDDNGVICGSIFNIATLAPPPVAPWQGEEVCVTVNPTWDPTVGPIGAWKAYRFAHAFNTGGSSNFDTQFVISQLSTTGKFLAFSSDWNCTLGTTAGTSTGVLCGAPWNPNYTYTLNQLVNPFANFNGSGTNFGVYKVTNIGTHGGVSASSKPAWFVCNSTSAGSTVTDANGVVYTCQGTSNGKGEVFVVKLN